MPLSIWPASLSIRVQSTIMRRCIPLSLSLSLSLSFLNSSHIFVYYFFPIFKQKVAVVVAIVIAIGSGIASAGHQPGINRRDPADDGPKRSEMPGRRDAPADRTDRAGALLL